METTKKSTFKVLFYLKKNAPKKNGKVTVMCRITVNGKQSAFSTKLDISATNWDLKYGRVLDKSREAQDTNSKLDKIRSGIEECYSKILKNEGAVNSAKLKNAVLGMESGELTFFKFYEQFLSDYEKKVNSGLRVNGTRSKYKILLKHLRNFAHTKYSYSDVSFNDLTPDFVQDFDYYLRDDQSLTHNTIWLYMIGFTTLCRLAMSRKHLAFNPFSEYKNTKKDKDRGYLLRNELEQLVTFNCDKKKDELVKDLFVFSCFTGLSYSDMKGLKNSNIQDFFDGNRWMSVRSVLKNTVELAIHTTSNETDFKKQLTEQGINTVVRRNSEGRIYGMTFIDHESRSVWNGSQLDRNLSANVFNDWWNNGNKPELKIQDNPVSVSSSCNSMCAIFPFYGQIALKLWLQKL